MTLASLILNIAVVVSFIVSCYSFIKETKSANISVKSNLLLAVRYFTVQSNIFAALVSFCLIIVDVCILAGVLTGLPFAFTIIKLMAATSVMLTFLVVLFYLLPIFGVSDLFKGSNFYMHLVTPLLSFFSLILFEGVFDIPLLYSLLSIIPVAAYTVLYTYKVIFAKKDQWDDMYQFNSGGKWYLVIPLMQAVTAVISLLITVLHNLILG